MVTASSGNHGQAVAYMAKTLVSILLFPIMRLRLNQAMEGYGAEIVLVGPMSNERLDMLKKKKGGYVTFLPMTI